MSSGNNSRSMVELNQIQHGEETQSQLRNQEIPSDNQSDMHHKTMSKPIQT